jgi:hypothetical protein
MLQIMYVESKVHQICVLHFVYDLVIMIKENHKLNDRANNIGIVF